ncbi:MAG TPA: AAA family ATPase [Solirubrobacteraceae bacterium]|nr:AAA family ATPase [Solirubrobacteraceae bacterium]
MTAGVAAGLLDALASPSMYPENPPVTVHETHASWVFLAGERAYKVKKPLDLRFLDYSTLPRRHAACRAEVNVNRELAPDIYLGVLAILSGEASFRFAEDGAPDAMEYAVEMVRFDEADTLAGLIGVGVLTHAILASVARRLADFHRAAPVVEDWGADRVIAAWRKNIAELRAIEPPEGWDLDEVARFGEAFVASHEHELQQRARAGLARVGHGDLRCEHVLCFPTVRVVDRIEFDPELLRIDVARDLAFLAMDLEAQGQAWAARELMESYSKVGLDIGSAELRSFYAAHCAFVRAKVTTIAAEEDEERQSLAADAQALWELGERLCWRARGPLAVVVCGPAASGKSTLAAELSRRSGLRVASSDALRKAAAGLSSTERGEPNLYSERSTHATYELLGEEADSIVRRDGGVIVDATCRARADRARLFHHLSGDNLKLLVVRCEAPIEVSLERATRRLRDAGRVSDATPEIAAEQFHTFEPLDEVAHDAVLKLNTERDLHTQVVQVTCAVDRR